jgi:hypothetical protein
MEIEKIEMKKLRVTQGCIIHVDISGDEVMVTLKDVDDEVHLIFKIDDMEYLVQKYKRERTRELASSRYHAKNKTVAKNK